jgi:hypothetical protein
MLSGPVVVDPLKLDLGADELDIKAEVPVEATVGCFPRSRPIKLTRRHED